MSDKENNKTVKQQKSKAAAEKTTEENNGGLSLMPPVFQLKTESNPSDNPNSKNEGNSGNAVMQKMENAFQTDFSNVQVHQNSKEATNIGAHAFASGNDVHFAPGQYNPNTQKGQELLGHELTHVVQQRQGRVQPTVQGKGLAINDDAGLEKEADDLGAKAAKGEKVSLNSSSKENNQTSIQRKVIQRNLNAHEFHAVICTMIGLDEREVRSASSVGHPDHYRNEFDPEYIRILWNIHKYLHPEDPHAAGTPSETWLAYVRAGLRRVEPAILQALERDPERESRIPAGQFTDYIINMLRNDGPHQQNQESEEEAQEVEEEVQEEPQEEAREERQEEEENTTTADTSYNGESSTTDLDVISASRTSLSVTGQRYTRYFINQEVYEFFRAYRIPNGRATRANIRLRNRIRTKINQLNTELYNFGRNNPTRAIDDGTMQGKINALKGKIMEFVEMERARLANLETQTAQTDDNAASDNGEQSLRQANTKVSELETGELCNSILVNLHIQRARILLRHNNEEEAADTAEIDAELNRLHGTNIADLQGAPRDVQNLESLLSQPRRRRNQAARRLNQARRPINQRLRPYRQAVDNRDQIQSLTHIRSLVSSNSFLSTVDQSQYRVRSVNRGVDSSNMNLTPVRGLYGNAMTRTNGYQNGGSQNASQSVIRQVARRHNIQGQNLDRAIAILETLNRNEGRMDSVNTWDRLSITLGPGLGGATRQRNGSYVANGTFTNKLAILHQRHPEIFYRYLGRFGVSMARGNRTGRQVRRGGWQQMTVVVPNESNEDYMPHGEYTPGQVLRGMDALNYIIEDPILLTQLRLLGREEVWQALMLDVVFERSFEETFTLQVPIGNGQEIPIENILNGLNESLIRGVFASYNDEAHGVGNLDTTLKPLLQQYYTELATAQGIELNSPGDLSMENRLEFARRSFNRPHMASRRNRLRAYMEAIDGLRGQLVSLGVVEAAEESEE